MGGNVTGFQRTFSFKANETFKTVGPSQAVVYTGTERYVEVPKEDNQLPVGIVTYQEERIDDVSVAVQLDRIAEATAAENIPFGAEVIVAAGGKIKQASSLADGSVANILGETQHSAKSGELVQVLIRPRAKTL
ncbi:hypothetical protein ACQKEX_15005 [Bacillus pumilus]|uniref:hypothetical protein n=1 Tax=Bacillus TaxID=1386 RepID=UPI000961E9A8|nr:hypothetical protein [Bacillus pumilus]MBU8576358.1 hypothetical protein [Bacillus pumilus]OLP64444.1 hypothetical protein BACPU_26690 [Bacillus pumilus]